ncbi:hypothetical protein PoB_004237500 [Plakobranchus ocellatus]|uniref:Uncharacterized protein n=1 Tax=Plakobranchus ocellatus TaxID=259542 RepID=A0AAV4B9U2_9GAST|nr:hypothetical protein PoB_004237500 [Plakobranchus ocellatus]
MRKKQESGHWFGLICFGLILVFIVRPQQGDIRLSGPPSGQGTGGEVQTPDGGIPPDIRADLLSTAPSMLHRENHGGSEQQCLSILKYQADQYSIT